MKIVVQEMKYFPFIMLAIGLAYALCAFNGVFIFILMQLAGTSLLAAAFMYSILNEFHMCLCNKLCVLYPTIGSVFVDYNLAYGISASILPYILLTFIIVGFILLVCTIIKFFINIYKKKHGRK